MDDRPNPQKSRRTGKITTYGSHSPAAGGDQYFGPYFGGDYNAGPGVFPTSGPAKFITGLGMIIGFAGFASFGYVILSFILQIVTSMAANHPPNIATVPFVPFLPIGAVLFFAGIILNFVGRFVDRS